MFQNREQAIASFLKSKGTNIFQESSGLTDFVPSSIFDFPLPQECAAISKQLKTFNDSYLLPAIRNEYTLNTKNFGQLYFGHLNFGQKLSVISRKLLILT